MSMRLALLAPLLAGLLLALACAPQEDVITQDIVSTIPWPDQERAEYVLLDRDGEEEQGSGVLTVARQDGRFELRLRFEGDETNIDNSTVLVDAETLKPISIHRERVIDNDTETLDATYDNVEGVVNIKATSGGDERKIPVRLKENSYDNDSSLYLWRTIDFQEGYEAAYRTVVTGGGVLQVVRLKVTGKESVTVPAGTFQAWRLEIRAADRKQIAWFADTPQRPLVQYDNSRQLFQLTALGEGR